jgi:DNA-binding response OmpR family regulator
MANSCSPHPLNAMLQGVNSSAPEALPNMASIDSPTVLIVEDHLLTRRFLADNLAADGYTPREAPTLADARRQIRGGELALAVLDLHLPDGDGLDLLAELRGLDGADPGLDPHLPVLVLSARGSEIERVRGLSRGADDYLPKPFSYNELRARIAALLRRSTLRPGTGRMRVGTLEIDPQSRQVWLEGDLVHLSGKEFGLVRMLASAPTRTFTRDELLREVWGYRSPVATRTLDTHAHRLRRKLSAGRRAFVINVWGVGYRLCDGPEGAGGEGREA